MVLTIWLRLMFVYCAATGTCPTEAAYPMACLAL